MITSRRLVGEMRFSGGKQGHADGRRAARLGIAVAVAVAFCASGVQAATAPTLVDSQQTVTGRVTYLNGPQRTGVYSSMRRLTPAGVAGKKFHRLFDQPLPDGGEVYAQPLLVAGRLVVATERNDVYELDPRTGASWRPARSAHPGTGIRQRQLHCSDLSPSSGSPAHRWRTT